MIKRAGLIFFVLLVLVALSNLCIAQTTLTYAIKPNSLVLKNDTLFWSDESESPVKQLSLESGELIHLARKMEVPVNYNVAGQYMYWVETRSGFSPSENCVATDATKILQKTN